MARIFTEYSDISENYFETEKKLKSKRHKKIKKLEKKIEKQEKIIRKLEEKISALEDSISTEDNRGKGTSHNGNGFINEIKGAFIKSLPGIFRVTVKTLVDAICSWSLKHFVKPQAA